MTKKIWTYIIAILCIIGGVYLIIKPTLSFETLVYYIGLVLLLTGIIKVLASLIIKESFLLPGNYFFGGILNGLFGIILMNNKSTAVNIISTIIGLWLIISGVSGLALILNLKRNKNIIDNNLLITNILKLILGIIVLTTPIITIVFTGWVLGLILILVGIIMIINSFKNNKIYKVKIK